MSGKVKHDWQFGSSFDVRATRAGFNFERVNPDAAQGRPRLAVADHSERLLAKVSSNGDALLPWLLVQAQADVLELPALLVARTIYRHSATQATPTRHLDRLAAVVDLNMAAWWQPTACAR